MPDDFDPALSLLYRLQAFLNPAQLFASLRRAGSRVGAFGEGLVRKYPRRTIRPLKAFYTRVAPDGSTYKSKFKTAKQQGWFFYALSKKLIKVPRTRTGNMGGGITSDVTVGTNLQTDVRIGGTEKYTPYVIGAPRGTGAYVYGMQTKYHEQGGWESLPKQLENHKGEAVGIYADSLFADLDKAIKAYTR